VALPASRLEEVLVTARQIAAAEAKIRDAVAGGERLDKARERLRYHALQSKPVY
jgi:hypothetical protein